MTDDDTPVTLADRPPVQIALDRLTKIVEIAREIAAYTDWIIGEVSENRRAWSQAEVQSVDTQIRLGTRRLLSELERLR